MKETLRNRVRNFINAHEGARDEALALIASLGKALLDRRISKIERADIVSKAEALIRALRNAPEEE